MADGRRAVLVVVVAGSVEVGSVDVVTALVVEVAVTAVVVGVPAPDGDAEAARELLPEAARKIRDPPAATVIRVTATTEPLRRSVTVLAPFSVGVSRLSAVWSTVNLATTWFGCSRPAGRGGGCLLLRGVRLRGLDS